MSTKRVILANNSRLLREMFRSVITKAEYLEVVHEVLDNEDLPLAIQRFCPEWVIVSLPLSEVVMNCIGIFLHEDPEVQFIFLSEDNRFIRLHGLWAVEQDLSPLSLVEFIYLLQKDRPVP